jgi:ethanolamine-phosphate cytidylyltransferase
MTTATIINRIFANRKAYEDRNAKKVASEKKYYKSKQHVTEG